jgi:hypothetical protein
MLKRLWGRDMGFCRNAKTESRFAKMKIPTDSGGSFMIPVAHGQVQLALFFVPGMVALGLFSVP